MPLWLNVIVVLLLRGLTVNGWRRYTDRYFEGEGKSADNRFMQMWWPVRASNCLILFGAGYYINDCLRHRPFGAQPAVSYCVWAIGLGFMLNHWEE